MPITPRTGFKPASTTTTTSASCTIDASTQIGDFVIVITENRGSTSRPSLADDGGGASWSVFQENTGAGCTTWWTKVAEAGTPGATLTLSGATDSCSMVGCAFGGVHAVTPTGAASIANRGGANYNTNGNPITTTKPGAHVVFGVAKQDDPAVTSIVGTDPAAYTERAQHNSTGGNDSMAVIASAAQSVVGAVGQVSWSQSGSLNKVWGIVELIPADVAIAPAAGDLVLSTSAPIVTRTDHQTIQPAAAQLALSSAAPAVVVSDHRTVSPAAADLTLTGSAPIVTVSNNVAIAPAAAQLVLSGSAPGVVTTEHHVIAPAAGDLLLSSDAPAVVIAFGAPKAPAGRRVSVGASRSVSVGSSRSARVGGRRSARV